VTSQAKAARSPRLGIVLLEARHYAPDFGLFDPSEERGLGRLPRGFFESPATWPVPTAYAVAHGADTAATLRGDHGMTDGLVGAVERLADHADLITTDCGFFYSAADEARDRTSVPLMVSGLEMIPLAGRLSPSPIGVLTASRPRVEEMLADHPDRERMRIVGLEEGPAWTAIGAEDFASMRGWDVESLRTEFLESATRAFRAGPLAEVGTVVLECTVFPMFRSDLRRLTYVPILDVASFSVAALGRIASGSVAWR
jgi:hypothetical protein